MMFGGGWWKWILSQLGCQSTFHTAGFSGQEAFGGVCVDQADPASQLAEHVGLAFARKAYNRLLTGLLSVAHCTSVCYLLC
jgi:hypothetical protein